MIGAQIGVSDQGLRINPLDTDNTRRLAVGLATISGVHGAGLVNRGIQATGYTDPQVIPLSQIQSVEPTRQARLFSPPQARVTLQDGSHEDFGFVHQPWAFNKDRKNVQTRDALVNSLNGLLSQR